MAESSGIPLERQQSHTLQVEAPSELPPGFDPYVLADAERCVAPFMRLLQKSEADPEIVSQLDSMVSVVIDREYASAAEAWRKCHQQFCPIRKSDPDPSDPAKIEEQPYEEKLLKSMRMLIRFTEVVQPNADPEKAFPKEETDNKEEGSAPDKKEDDKEVEKAEAS